MVQQRSAAPIDEQGAPIHVHSQQQGAIRAHADCAQLPQALKGQRAAGGLSEVHLQSKHATDAQGPAMRTATALCMVEAS